ncbi:MAG: hypothetical protein NWF01_11375 [Candidatus Bathyarchaeota archaeon]|nr:hypothetical protein [Candidatus Bathyarchaeota archaeon]
MAKEGKNHQKPLAPHLQWLQTWKESEQNVSELPNWTQKIILQNQITTMQKANQKSKHKKVKITPGEHKQDLVQSIEGEN